MTTKPAKAAKIAKTIAKYYLIINGTVFLASFAFVLTAQLVHG